MRSHLILRRFVEKKVSLFNTITKREQVGKQETFMFQITTPDGPYKESARETEDGTSMEQKSRKT